MKKTISMMMVLFPLAAACGGAKKETVGPVTPTGPAIVHPEWVLKGSGAFGGEKRIIYGVGVASGVRNVALARSTADNRARSEVSKVFSTYSTSLMKDYASSTTVGDMSASDEQQMVEQAIKTFSKMEMSGVEIIDHWINPSDGSIYALARYDISGFEELVSGHKQLSAAVKQRVKQASDRAFAEMEKEEAKLEAEQSGG